MNAVYLPPSTTPLPTGPQARIGEAWATAVEVRSYDGEGSLWEVDAFRNGYRLDCRCLVDGAEAHALAAKWAARVVT